MPLFLATAFLPEQLASTENLAWNGLTRREPLIVLHKIVRSLAGTKGSGLFEIKKALALVHMRMLPVRYQSSVTHEQRGVWT